MDAFLMGDHQGAEAGNRGGGKCELYERQDDIFTKEKHTDFGLDRGGHSKKYLTPLQDFCTQMRAFALNNSELVASKKSHLKQAIA